MDMMSTSFIIFKVVLVVILNDIEIKKLAKEKNLISPFDDAYLQGESYDLHLGDEVSVLKSSKAFIDLGDSKTLDCMYEHHKLNDLGFLIEPNQFVLVSLLETITLPDFLSAEIRPRTRFIRAGIFVSGQHCSSTYSGKLRVGLYNMQRRPIRIREGIGICQVVFEQLSAPPSDEKQYRNKVNARYQDEKDFRGPMADPEFRARVDSMVNSIIG